MFLLPCLRLSKGESLDALPMPSEGEALPSNDPKEVALRLQRLGAVGLHLVDVDAARGKSPNDEALLSVLDSVSIPVQVGGGVRSMRRIQELLDTGARSVVVGSFGVEHADWLREAARCFPRGLVANLDESDGRVLIKSRSEDSGKRVESLALEYDGWGFEGILLTALKGTVHEGLRGLIRRLKTPVMVDARVKDVGELQAFRDAGVRAAVLGAEIYDGTIDFQAANQVFHSL